MTRADRPRRKRSASVGRHLEGGEVISGDILAAQGLGQLIGIAAADAETRTASLEGGELLELRRRGGEALIELIREEPPTVILQTALHAAIVAVTRAIKAGWIGHRQRLEHDGVNEREDRGGCADAQCQSEHGGKREDGRQPHLP